MIFCEFEYCVYNRHSSCRFKNINISSLGFCEDCIIAGIDLETLEKYKRETLKQLDVSTINRTNKKK